MSTQFKPVIGEMHRRADGEIVGPVTANYSDRYPFRIGKDTYAANGRYWHQCAEHGMNLVATVAVSEPAAVRTPDAILTDMAAAGFIVADAEAAQVEALGEAGALRKVADAMAYTWGEDHADEQGAAVISLMTSAPADANDWNVEPGYEALSGIFREAHNVAAHGKGKARHANGERFEDQLLMAITSRHGIGFPLGQAEKKLDEAHGMVRRGEGKAAVAELLDVINYAAAAILHIRAL